MAAALREQPAEAPAARAAARRRSAPPRRRRVAAASARASAAAAPGGEAGERRRRRPAGRSATRTFRSPPAPPRPEPRGRPRRAARPPATPRPGARPPRPTPARTRRARRGARASRRHRAGSRSPAGASVAMPESYPPLTSAHGRRRRHAVSRPRNQDRGGLLLVRRPLPDHLLALGLLPRRAQRGRRRLDRPTCSPWPAPRSSSPRSCCTSWATPSWRCATGSASRRSRSGCSAASRAWRRTPTRRGPSSRSRSPGPLVTAAIVVVCAVAGLLLAGGDEFRHAALTQQRHPDLRRRGAGRLARQHQPARPDLQPGPRLPARRRPHRAGDRLVAHRQPQHRDPLRGHARRVVRPLPDPRRPRLLPGLPGRPDRRHLARLRRLHPPRRGQGGDRPDRGDQPDRGRSRSPT